MIARALGAVDGIIGLGLGAFKKAFWILFLTAAVAASLTATVFITTYAVMK